jgi:tetratricopeptide (TPR) repeat protein
MSDSLDQLLVTGLRFHREGRFEEARDIYRQVLRDRPDHARAHHLLGLALRHRDQEAEAVRHFERATAIEPAEPLYRATLADSYRVLGNIPAARAELMTLAEQEVDEPDLRIQIGTQWGLLGETKRALDYCRPVLEMFPDHARGNQLLGTILHEQGKDADAIAPLEKARQGDAPVADPTCALASALLVLGRYEELIGLGRPRDGRQLFGEGTLKSVVLWLTGRSDEAKQFAEAARSHGERLGEWPQKGAFIGMLDQVEGLYTYRSAHRPTYASAAHATLAVVGDEQAVAAANFVTTVDGRSTRLVGIPVFGCRALHIVSEPNRFQDAFFSALDRLAPGDRFVSLVGSLDCRVSGLLAELPLDDQGRWADLTPAAQLADRFVDRLAAESARRDLQPILMGPPASNLQVLIMKALARDAYLAIIERFNAAMKAAARRHGLPFADLLSTTRGLDGLGRATLYIDKNYVLPTAIAGALAELQPSSPTA